MTFQSKNLTLRYASSSGINEWEYLTTDNISTVLGSNYFALAAIRGMMRVSDTINIYFYTSVDIVGVFSGLISYSRGIVTSVSGIAATVSVDAPDQAPVMVGDTGNGGVAGIVPAPAAGDALANRFLKADGTWAVTPTGSSGITNLTASETSTTVSIASSTGSGCVLPAATVSLAGVLDAARAAKIDGLATVAVSGSYADLSSKPSIPAAQVNSDWNASSGLPQILNKPSFAAVATSGSATDLGSGTINKARLPITPGSFTLNTSATSTAVTISGATSSTKVIWSPTTANAASMFPFLYGTCSTNSLNLSHPSSSNSDITYNYIALL